MAANIVNRIIRNRKQIEQYMIEWFENEYDDLMYSDTDRVEVKGRYKSNSVGLSLYTSMWQMFKQAKKLDISKDICKEASKYTIKYSASNDTDKNVFIVKRGKYFSGESLISCIVLEDDLKDVIKPDADINHIAIALCYRLKKKIEEKLKEYTDKQNVIIYDNTFKFVTKWPFDEKNTINFINTVDEIVGDEKNTDVIITDISVTEPEEERLNIDMKNKAFILYLIYKDGKLISSKRLKVGYKTGITVYNGEPTARIEDICFDLDNIQDVKVINEDLFTISGAVKYIFNKNVRIGIRDHHTLIFAAKEGTYKTISSSIVDFKSSVSLFDLID